MYNVILHYNQENKATESNILCKLPNNLQSMQFLIIQLIINSSKILNIIFKWLNITIQ